MMTDDGGFRGVCQMMTLDDLGGGGDQKFRDF